VVAAYRYMLDNWRFDRERAASKASAMLQGDFARHKTTFWFDGTAAPNFIRPDQAGGTGIALGKIKVVRVFDEKRWILVRSLEGIAEGDSIRVHGHGDTGRSTARVRGVMEKPEGLYLQVDGDFGPEDEVYLVQTKKMSKRYKPVLPSSLSKYHAFPSYDSAPRAEFPAIPKNRLAVLPDGLYSMVSRIQDLHTILTDRPEKAILRLSRKNADLLRRHEKETPFKRDTLILSLEPYFPQGDAAWLAEELDYWISKGQRIFIANNLGHLALLKGRDVSVVAGPWLYAFNSWAAAFLLGNGTDFIVPPLEISKQAFGRMTEVVPAKSLFPVVFAYPQLFTIRTDMGELFDLRFLRDRDGDEYELVSSPDGSVVIPIKPFSLVDRIPFLKKDGASKFILDFSFIDLKKQVYKRVLQAARDGVVLPDTGRFNWKEGFWNPEEEAVQTRASDSGARPAGRPRPAGEPGADGGPDRSRVRANGGAPQAGDGGTSRRGRGAPAGTSVPRTSAAPRTGGRKADRPGRGGHPWKVALAEGRVPGEDRVPASGRSGSGSRVKSGAAGRTPARQAGAQRESARGGSRQSDRTSANVPARRSSGPRTGKPKTPRQDRTD